MKRQQRRFCFLRQRYARTIRIGLEALRNTQTDAETVAELDSLYRNPLGFYARSSSISSNSGRFQIYAATFKVPPSYFKEAVAIPFLAYHHLVTQKLPSLARGSGVYYGRGIDYLQNCFNLLNIPIGENALADMNKVAVKAGVEICEAIMKDRKKLDLQPARQNL